METEIEACFSSMGPRRSWLVFAAWVLVSLSSVMFLSAQVTRLDDLGQVGEDAVVISFGQFPGPRLAGFGTELGEVFERWGVRFQATGGNRLRISAFTVSEPFGPPPADFFQLVHEPVAGGVDGPLTLSLGRPAARVVLFIQGHPEQAELQAYAPDGALLGGVQLAGLDSPGSFLGLETTDPRGVAMVVLRYTAPDPVEKVSLVGINYLEEVSGFTVFLPQVGFGSGDGVELDTQVSLLNLANAEASVTVRLFQGDGSPMETAFAPDGQWSFTLPPFGVDSVNLGSGLAADSELQAGYARIDSTQPLEATAVFTTGAEGLVFPMEAGVGSALPQFLMSGPVEKLDGEGLNTGVAAANPGPDTVEVTFIALDSAGAMRTTRSIAPGVHVALFLDDLFPELRGRDFKGLILVEGSRTLVATLLRTRGGMAASSLPLAGLLQQRIQ